MSTIKAPFASRGQHGGIVALAPCCGADVTPCASKLAGADRRPGTPPPAQVDTVVRRIVHAAFDSASALLRENRSVLNRCAQALLKMETLEVAEIKRLTGDLKRATQAASAATTGTRCTFGEPVFSYDIT